MDPQHPYSPEQAQRFLKALLQHLPDAFCFIYDHDLRYIEAMGGGMARAGLSREQLVGRTLREALPADTAAALEPVYRAALTGEEPRLNISFGDGTFELTLAPVLDEQGLIVAGMMIASDVTERREVSARVRLYERIVENAPDAVFVYDNEGKVSYANSSAATLLGLESSEQVIGGAGAQWIDPEHLSVIEEIGTALATEGAWRGQIWSIGPGDRRFLTETVSFRLDDENGVPTGTLTFARDMTDRLREEEQRAEIQQQVIEAQQAALRELSTPLIPLADNVVVMPLVGTIDSRRAGQIMETLLEGVAANQADIALLDISGVRVVDTQVADALLRAAKAAKLLGTRIVLTGIKAEVAQTIVHLGADMTEIVTRSNLQEGLRYALVEGGSEMAAGLRSDS